MDEEYDVKQPRKRRRKPREVYPYTPLPAHMLLANKFDPGPRLRGPESGPDLMQKVPSSRTRKRQRQI